MRPLPTVSERHRVRKGTQVILRLSAQGNLYAFSLLPSPFKLGGLGVSLLTLWVSPQAAHTELFLLGGVARWGVSPALLTWGVTPTGILEAGRLGSA